MLIEYTYVLEKLSYVLVSGGLILLVWSYISTLR